jgi:HK97 family phage portal protein
MGFGRRLLAAATAFSQPELQAVTYGASDSVSDHSNWLIRAIGAGRAKSGASVSEHTALHLPVVYAAVSIIADTLAQLPLNVMRKRASGRGSDVADDLALHEILHDQANEHMASFTWRSTIQHHVLLWGNGYSELEQNGRGETVGIWPLLPDRTLPRKDRDGLLAYRTNIAGGSYDLPPERILHIPALGFDGYVGHSPLAKAREAVALGLAMEEFGAKFFANDAKSGGFLMHPNKLSDQARAHLTGPADKRIDPAAGLQRQGGLDNAHKVKLLEEGMKFISTTIPPEDAQFLGSREFQIAEIARIYRVPLILLSSHEKTSSWGSGIEQLMIGFVVWTIQPWVVRWEQELNRKLFTRAERAAGYFVKFNLNALMRGDMKSRANFYESAIRSKWMVPNEAREKEDMNPREGGDEVPDLQGAPSSAPRPAEPPENDDTEEREAA